MPYQKPERRERLVSAAVVQHSGRFSPAFDRHGQRLEDLEELVGRRHEVDIVAAAPLEFQHYVGQARRRHDLPFSPLADLRSSAEHTLQVAGASERSCRTRPCRPGPLPRQSEGRNWIRPPRFPPHRCRRSLQSARAALARARAAGCSQRPSRCEAPEKLASVVQRTIGRPGHRSFSRCRNIILGRKATHRRIAATTAGTPDRNACRAVPG